MNYDKILLTKILLSISKHKVCSMQYETKNRKYIILK